MRRVSTATFDYKRRAIFIGLPWQDWRCLPCPVRAEAFPPRRNVPYVPTPMEVVNKMLDLGNVGRDDMLYDLGCGDGRIVVTAAKERGARGVGIDIDPQRIAAANETAKGAGVQDRVQFRKGDLFKSDCSPATVVTLYLQPGINRRLRPQDPSFGSSSRSAPASCRTRSTGETSGRLSTLSGWV